MRSTHTYVICQISKAAFDEIHGKMKEAGYEHSFDSSAEGGLAIDMHGVAIQAQSPPVHVDIGKYIMRLPHGGVVDFEDYQKLADLSEAFRVGLDELCRRHHVRLLPAAGDEDFDDLKIVVDCEPGFDGAIEAELGPLICEPVKP